MSSNGIDSNGMGGNGTKNGSGLKNAHIRVSSSSIEPLTKMERLMYHGIVTPSLSAHILYCLQHSSIHLNVLHSLLHLSLDSNIEKDETNNSVSVESPLETTNSSTKSCTKPTTKSSTESCTTGWFS